MDEDVDGRDKPGHDGGGIVAAQPRIAPVCSIAAGHKEEYRTDTQLEASECFSVGEVASWWVRRPVI